MQDLVKYIFLFLVGTTVLNLFIAVAARLKTESKEFNILVLYWVSLFATYFAAATLSYNTGAIAFSYFFHVVPTFLMVKMLTDSRGFKFNLKLYSSIWAIGAILSAFLIANDVSFTASLIPITFGTTLPYISITWSTLVTDRKKSNWIEKGMAWMFISGLINHWNFAFFRLDESAQWWGWSVSVAQYQCLSIFLPLLINYNRSIRERKNVEHALEKLSGQNPYRTVEINELYAMLEREIAHKETLMKELKLTNENLQEEQNTNDILIKTVSHDLANPLTVINAYIDMIQTGRIRPEDISSTLSKVKLNCNSALDMISRTRDAILTKNQALIIDLHKVSVDRAILKAIDLLGPKAKLKNLRINYNNQSSPESFAIAEENTLVEHVLSNIISNAIKFSHDNSSISIQVTEDKDNIKIQVKDQGVGISQKRLFENKFLLSTEGTNGENGSGFGIMILNYFMKKYGGFYNLHSDGEDKGTTVTLHLQKTKELLSPKFEMPTTFAN